jgi:hypothetical protein
MKLAVYHNSVPNAKNQEKIDLLNFYGQGVRAAGDEVIDVRGFSYNGTEDVAIIQGWVDGQPESRNHLRLRYDVIQSSLRKNKYVVVVDSNLFLYANTANSLHYLRYSFNGIFPNTGIYCDTTVDPSRWTKISKNLNLTLKDYRTIGDHILICLQRNGGWSMGDIDVQDWAIQTINTIRSYSDRPIVIRAHPGDKASRGYLDPRNPNCKIKFSKAVRLSTNVNLVDDLKNCWAAVNYNSSPVVGAAIEGVPIFVTDPDRSQCAEIANLDLTQIENPILHDRQRWVDRLSMFHWNFDELKSGECWNHMKYYVK